MSVVRPESTGPTIAAVVGHQWFEIEEPGEDDDSDDFREFLDTERAFVEVLQKRTASCPAQGVSGFVGRPDDESALLVALAIQDTGRILFDFGAHFTGSTVVGDRLHSQLYYLPRTPSPWALRGTDGVRELAEPIR